MAKRMRDDDDPDRQHNVGEVKKIIQEAASNIIRLKAEQAAIREQITEQRGKIKSLGVKAVDFNVALRLQELEAKDRNESLDNIRLCFEALGIGVQGDLFPASDDLPAGAMQPYNDAEPDSKRKSRAGKALDAAMEHLGTA